MLSLGVRGFPPPPTPPCNNFSENPISQSFLFPNKIHKTYLSFCSNKVTQLGFCGILGRIRNGSSAFAINSPRKGNDGLLGMKNFDVNINFEDEEEDDEDEDEEEIVIPIRNMRKWLENKPPGFGEGKEYDTSIEDKLAEEMEQSRLAQLANINNLKNNPEGSNSKKEKLQKQRVSEVVPSGICVQLFNLPKKKNIHRDLQRAFKGVQGIINIVPVVSGNKKTREPICKGIAFVYFKSKDEANRFIHIFSTQSIAFGKIQKQIRYEMMNSSSPKPANEKLADSDHDSDHAPYVEACLENDLDADSNTENFTFNLREETVFREYDSTDDELVSTVWEDEERNLGTFSIVESRGNDSRLLDEEFATNLLSSNSKQQEKKRAKKRNEKLADSDNDSDHTPYVVEACLENDPDADSNTKNFAFNLREETVPREYDGADDELVSTVWEDEEGNLETFNILEPSSNDSRLLKEEVATNLLSSNSKQQEKKRPKGKKIVVKRKGKKVPKLNIPGSANRLKIKEKAVLTDVFSKYGPNADLAVKENSQ